MKKILAVLLALALMLGACCAFAETAENPDLKNAASYLFMLYKFHSKDIYMSQSTMGRHIGVPQTTVSGIVAKLEARRFLRIRKKFRKNGILSYEYDLMR